MPIPNQTHDRCQGQSRLSRAVTMAVARADLIEAIDRALLAGMTGPDIMAIVHQRIHHHRRSVMRTTAATPQRRQF